MMKRLPVLFSFLAFVALCISLSYWGMRIFKPTMRSVTVPAPQSFEPAVGQWGGLFGDVPGAVAAPSNYQLKGIILAKRAHESVAILSENGKPALAIGLGKELLSGVVLKEVHAQYVLISEHGAIRRVELPQNAPLILPENRPAETSMGIVPPAPPAFPPHAQQGMPQALPQPMVTPGLPTASLPAVVSGNVQ